MTEEGYLDHSPKFGLVRRKIWLRAVSNTILDIRLQTMNMTDQQAMDLMLNAPSRRRLRPMANCGVPS